MFSGGSGEGFVLVLYLTDMNDRASRRDSWITALAARVGLPGAQIVGEAALSHDR